MSDDPTGGSGWATPPPAGKGHGRLFWAVMIIALIWLLLSVASCVAVMLMYG
jgi:hypothetical protein